MRLPLNPSSRHSDGQRGVSLLSVLIGLGLLSICAVIFMNGMANDRSEGEILAAKRSVHDIESSLQVFLWNQIKTYALQGCVPDKFDELFSDQKIGATAIPRLAHGRVPADSGAPDVHRDAAKRCANVSIADPSGSTFHFCLYLESTEKNEDTASFLKGNQPFTEVFVKLRHPASNAPASCMDLARSTTTTASVYYGIYWSRGHASTGAKFGRYLGVFDASR